MLKSVNRDLLVISKKAQRSSFALQQEIDLLNELLCDVEILHNIAVSSEVIDLNRYRVVQRPDFVARILKEKNLRSFIFICNKN